MGMTIIEKIIAAHAGKPVRPGDVVWMDLDVRSARDFGGANVVKNFRRHFPGEPLHDPATTFFTFDCNAPANTIPYAENQRLCRLFAREHGVKVFDVNRGIGSHVLIEEGVVKPGSTVVGTDSHFNIMGAVGAFGQGMGDSDIAYAFRFGRTWFEVPPTVKLVLEGLPGEDVTPRDVTFAVMRRLGSSGALGKAVEIYGPVLDRFDLSGRITLASQGTETGAVSFMLPPSRELLEELGLGAEEAIAADEDAEYIEEIRIDISELEPLAAVPPSPTNIKPVRELSDVKVDAVFLGSCTNGRYEDLAAAAELLRGRKVAEGVNMFVVPATSRVYGRLLEEGLVDVFFRAGAVVSNPGCGGCASGQIGMTGTGEVMVSTSNRNFRGKQGNGLTYLASPVTAACSAVRGFITSKMED